MAANTATHDQLAFDTNHTPHMGAEQSTVPIKNVQKHERDEIVMK